MPVVPYTNRLEPAEDAVIWRYMDLRKFRDLMASEELYFRRADLFTDTSVDRAKPAICRHVKTGHFRLAVRGPSVLLRPVVRTQIGLHFCSPAARAALEDVRVVQQPIE